MGNQKSKVKSQNDKSKCKSFHLYVIARYIFLPSLRGAVGDEAISGIAAPRQVGASTDKYLKWLDIACQ